MADETGEPEGVAEAPAEEIKPTADIDTTVSENAEEKPDDNQTEPQTAEPEKTSSDHKESEPEKDENVVSGENPEDKDNADEVEDEEDKKDTEEDKNIEREQTVEKKSKPVSDEVNLVEEENPEEEQVGEEQVEGETQPEKITEEGLYEEIDEEIVNEEGEKVIKKIKKKIKDPGQLITVPPEEAIEEQEEEQKEEEKEEEKPAAIPYELELEMVEEEQVMEEVPPDPAAPLDFSDSKEALKPPYRLRPDQIAELESLWDLYQNYTPVYSDIDGYITEKELTYMLKSLLLMTYTVEQMHELIAFVCRPPHPKGHISYEQFVKIVTLRQRDLDAEDELRSALKIMDFDNTGTVDREFFRDILLTRGNRMTHKLVDYLIKEVDITNDGELGVEDVVGTIGIDLNREDIDMLRKTLFPDEYISDNEEGGESEDADNEAPDENEDDDDDSD